MASSLPTLCPRCGRHNPPRARYCGQCGLSLPPTGGDDLTRLVRGRNHRSGIGLVFLLVLLGVFLATMASLFRVRPAARPFAPVRHEFFDESSPRWFPDQARPDLPVQRHRSWNERDARR